MKRKYKKHKDNPTSFKKGRKPWNKGKPGYQISSKSKGYIDSHGYLVFCIKKKQIFAHRMIWEKYHGKIPKGYIIHHKDKNRLNNDISNLKLITRGEHSKIHKNDRRKK